MLKRIKQWWAKGATEPSAVVVPQVMPSYLGVGLDVYPTDDEPGDYAVTRYPPFDQGIPVLDVHKLLRAQQDLVDRIYRTAGVSRAEFGRLFVPPIANMAKHVHLLPATPKTYFRGTGGLFRMSLEIALNALQAAHASVFPTGGGVERRYAMLPRWTLATFLAGLCCQNYRTVNMMAVLTRDNNQWAPLISGLYDWCQCQNADVYFVRWMDDNHVHGAQAAAAYSIAQVVPAEVLQYLATDNNQVVPAMTAAIAGVEMNMSENPIGRLVAPVVTRVIESDLKRSAINYGHLVIGAHLETHLIDAMRQLVRGGKWITNNQASGGRLWVGQEGVFIDWQAAAGDIATLLAKNAFAGVPQDPDTLADLLVSANLLTPTVGGDRYWSIILPGIMEAKDGMVKLRERALIFPDGFAFDAYKDIRLTLTQSSTKSATEPARDGKAKEARNNGGGLTETENQSDAASVAPRNKANARKKQAQERIDTSTGEILSPQREPETIKTPDCTDKESGCDVPPPTPPKSDAPIDPPADQPATPAGVGEKLLASLQEGHAWLIKEILQSHKAGTTEGVVAMVKDGLAISNAELARHGIPVPPFLEELGMKGWLWQDKTRASRRLHPFEINGKTERVAVLKRDIASALGFSVPEIEAR